MFDKKIILLPPLLLILGSSYFVFHRKKNNNDEVNIVDHSDNSINEYNINTEKSSSLLLFVVIIVVIIIITIAILFFIFYRKNEKPTTTIINIKNNEENKIFEEYKKFKEVEKNKQKIKEEIESKNVNLTVNLKIFANNVIGFKKRKTGNYVDNKYIIDFNCLFANDELENPPKEDNSNLMIFRLNFKEHNFLFTNMFYMFFDAIKNTEKYNNFKNKKRKTQRNIIFFFIATIIEPFFKAIQEKTYDKNTFIFVCQENNSLLNNQPCLNKILSSTKHVINEQIESTMTQVLKSNIFASIFNRLIREYFPNNFSFRKKQPE